jgi:serine/threonine-protein kinase
VTADSDTLIGHTIGPYRIETLLGQGGFAWVFAARRTDDNVQVAVKVLKPRYAGDAQFENRFRNEAEVAANLRHPSIIQIFEVGQVDGYTFFSMPLYPDSLGSLLQRETALDEPRAVAIGRDVAAGLAYAHEAGLVHRDIKPDNVLLTNSGTAVIADFGIARAVSGYASATGVDMTIGTPQYISPEQAQGRPMDGRSDLYALGVLLYKSTTGEVPFRSTDWFELARMHVEEQPPAPRKKRPEMSARLERVIVKCLAKHPDDRYPSAGALVEELDAIADASRATRSFGVAPVSTAEYSRLSRERRRPRWIVPLVATAFILAVAVLVVLLGR